jgi:hypothetical protein
VSSPIVRAPIGKVEGDTVEVRAPGGALRPRAGRLFPVRQGAMRRQVWIARAVIIACVAAAKDTKWRDAR